MTLTISANNKTLLADYKVDSDLQKKNMKICRPYSHFISLFLSQNLEEVRTGFCAMIQTLEKKQSWKSHKLVRLMTRKQEQVNGN